MDLEKQRLAEYAHLRQEILDADKSNYQVIGFALAASGLLFARAFDIANPAQGAMILAILQVFAFPCHLLLRANRRRVWRLATYLRHYVEPELPGVRWETRLAELRRKGRTSNGSRFSTHVIGTESVIMLMISVAAMVAETMILLAQPGSPSPLEGRAFFASYLVNLSAALYYLFDRKHSVGLNAGSEEVYAEGWKSIGGSAVPGPGPRAEAPKNQDRKGGR